MKSGGLERKTRKVREVKDKDMFFSLWVNSDYLSTRPKFLRERQLTSPGMFNSVSS